MKIGILGGTGDLGRGLALRLALAGHEVIIGSRAFERSEEAAAELNAKLTASNAQAAVRPATNASAAELAELVVLAVPAKPDAGFFDGIISALQGKTLLDCTVDLDPSSPTRVNPGVPGTSLRLQQLLGDGVTVIGGFHTLAAAKLLDITKPLSADTFIVGDSVAAKEAVITLAESIGLRCFDAGELAAGRTLERMTAMLISLNKRYKRRGLGFTLSGL